ncbi:hypothetical protein FOA52_008766 [Chlamydomonas sp. UWO 241]|nr:hypothetical protein FOA52_008766 [Chlamydomonas sp. UWO 241]
MVLSLVQAMLPARVWLSRWLLLAAGLRTFSVYIGFFSPGKFKVALFTRKPQTVTDAFGRLFGTWTAVTCVLCVICSSNTQSRPIYDATLASFGIAFAYMSMELLVYKTIGWKGVISPFIIAGVSLVWMLAGYGVYVK